MSSFQRYAPTILKLQASLVRNASSKYQRRYDFRRLSSSAPTWEGEDDYYIPRDNRIHDRDCGSATLDQVQEVSNSSSTTPPVSEMSTSLSSSSAENETLILPTMEVKHYVPRAERSPTKQTHLFDPIIKDRLMKINRKCPTRELNYNHCSWERHKNPYRRLRHLLTIFQSSPFRRLVFPELSLTASVGLGLAYYNEVIVGGDVAKQLFFSDGGTAMGGATTAIGLLAAFRLNASYGRYEEARKFWGEINNASRDLAGNVMMWIGDEVHRDRMIKLIQSFPVVLQWHLNEKGGHFRMLRKDPNFEDQKYANFVGEMRDIYEHDDTHPDFIQICNDYKNGGHGPLNITAGMRQIIAQNNQIKHNGPDSYALAIYNKEMDEQVCRLVGCLGMCERVLRTPIPTCFTRHTSRLLFFWANMLPFTMYSSLGPYGTIPASLLVSYAILGIADIGVQLEEPFNILPLRQYSEGIFDGVNGIRNSYDVFGTNYKRFTM